MSAFGIGTIGAIAAGAGTLFQVGEGLYQNKKANDLEKKLKDPQYNIPDEFRQNVAIARQMAQLGLPQQQYNNQLNEIHANQASALATAQRSANPGSQISSITGQANTATNNLTAEDAAARATNQRYFLQENAQMGGQKLAQQQANVFDPYTQHYNEMQAYRGAGLQNMNNAFQDVGQLGAMAVKYGLDNSKNTQTMGQKLGQSPIELTAPTPIYDGGQINSATDFVRKVPGTPGTGINQFNYGAPWGWPNQ